MTNAPKPCLKVTARQSIWRQCVLTLALAAATASTGCATAHGGVARRSLAEVEIVDRVDGRVLPVYRKDGQAWVVGTPGREYSVRIRNVDGGRLLAVTSVDGVNVISGETAAPTQSGYVLDPWASVDIAGWRKNLARTAAFYFADLPDSYAARTGRPDHVGVIGVAVFRERIPAAVGKIGPPRANEADRAGAAAPYPAAPYPAASAPRQDAAGETAARDAAAGGVAAEATAEARPKRRRSEAAAPGAARTARRATQRAGRAAVRAGPAAGGEARHRPRPHRDLARADGGVRTRQLAAGGGDQHPLRPAREPDRDGRAAATGRAGAVATVAVSRLAALRARSAALTPAPGRAERRCAKAVRSGRSEARLAARAGRSHTRGRCPRNPFRPPATRR